MEYLKLIFVYEMKPLQSLYSSSEDFVFPTKIKKIPFFVLCFVNYYSKVDWIILILPPVKTNADVDWLHWAPFANFWCFEKKLFTYGLNKIGETTQLQIYEITADQWKLVFY